MSEIKRRYWAFREDTDNTAPLFQELQAGRARMGWGYDPSQDLRLIQAEADKGGEWWKRINREQTKTLRHMKMLGLGDDSIKKNDILLIPNLPKYQYFCIAKVTGGYYYDMLKLSADQDVNQLGEDYGHILPVELLTPQGINKFNKEVHAQIRGTLRTPMRLWNLDYYGQHIEHLISLTVQNKNLVESHSGSERLETAWDLALSKAEETLKNRLMEELDSKFNAAEWEEPILTVLRNFYPGTDVKWTAGSGEHGADIVIQIPNHFDDAPSWLIVVQVKNYSGEIGIEVLNQIEEAHNHYSLEGRIISGIILTTAEKRSEEFNAEMQKLEQKLNFEIKLILKKRLIDLMTNGLSSRLVKDISVA